MYYRNNIFIFELIKVTLFNQIKERGVEIG